MTAITQSLLIITAADWAISSRLKVPPCCYLLFCLSLSQSSSLPHVLRLQATGLLYSWDPEGHMASITSANVNCAFNSCSIPYVDHIHLSWSNSGVRPRNRTACRWTGSACDTLQHSDHQWQSAPLQHNPFVRGVDLWISFAFVVVYGAHFTRSPRPKFCCGLIWSLLHLETTVLSLNIKTTHLLQLW